VVYDVEPAAALGMTGVLLDRRSRHEDFEGRRITSLDELPGCSVCDAAAARLEPAPERRFTLEEAEAALPDLRRPWRGCRRRGRRS
jgi:hypothetical protein